MILDKFIDILKDKFNQTDPENKEWFDKLVEAAEEHWVNFDSLPFTIIEQKEHGFIVKVNGLFAYISFYHMPWKYQDARTWTAIAPYLIDKRFYCKIHEIKKEPSLSIVIDGDTPQFKKAELTTGEEYNALIIKKTHFGLFVDLGYHFGWTCGSVQGLLHKSEIVNEDLFLQAELGQEITVIHQGVNDKGQFIFTSDREKADWQLGIPQGLVGTIIWAKVLKETENSKNIELLVRGRYKAKLTIDKSFEAKQKRKLKELKNSLQDGQIINCDVLDADPKTRRLKVKWWAELDTDIELASSLKSSLDKDVIANLEEAKTRMYREY